MNQALAKKSGKDAAVWALSASCALAYETLIGAPIVRSTVSGSTDRTAAQQVGMAGLSIVAGLVPVALAASLPARPGHPAAAFAGALLYQRWDNLVSTFGRSPTVGPA
jgi:hypothetical protein